MAPSSENGKYRPDIDGLRALAILPVLFFHAGVPGFAGGYVGVDIFFVISGFLITQILLRDLDENRFSIANFYARRIRRIVPALTAILLFVAVVSAVLLLPYDLAQNSRALVSAVTFTANFELWHQSNYFAPQAQYKPLLHTWSLSIEEQFYLLYPLFLSFALRWHRARLVPILAVLLLASLALCAGLTLTHPTSAFYFTFARAWELLLGCLVAVMPVRRALSSQGFELLSLFGVIAIVWSVFTFTGDVNFGYWLVVPAIGTAAIIYANARGNTWTKQVLSFPPIVFVGLVSYSLYLWHWPLLAFVRVWVLHPLPLAATMVVLALSFVVAVLSWKYIEQPFRKPDGVIPRAAMFRTAGVTAIVFALIGVTGYASQGLPQRFAPEVAAISRYEDYETAAAPQDGGFRTNPCHAGPVERVADLPPACFSGEKRNVLLLGDSHADHFSQALREKLQPRATHLVQVTMSACPPLMGFVRSGHPHCNGYLEFVAARELASLDAVVLSAEWDVYDHDLKSGSGDLIAELAKTIRVFRDRNIPVIIIGPSPQYTTSFSQIMARYLASAGNPRFAPDTFLDPQAFATDMKLRASFGRQPGVTYLSLTDILCSQQRCLTLLPRDVPLIWDEGHFTRSGAELVMERTFPLLLQSLEHRNEAS